MHLSASSAFKIFWCELCYGGICLKVSQVPVKAASLRQLLGDHNLICISSLQHTILHVIIDEDGPILTGLTRGIGADRKEYGCDLIHFAVHDPNGNLWNTIPLSLLQVKNGLALARGHCVAPQNHDGVLGSADGALHQVHAIVAVVPEIATTWKRACRE